MTTATEELPATMDDAFYLQHQETAGRIAAREHRSSTIYDVEDLEQAIWEHVVKAWPEYAGQDEKLVYVLMRRAARTYATQARIEHMYATGSFIYTPKLVAAYLDTCAWKPIEEVPDVDARVDMQEAYELLRKKAPRQAAAVFKRYGLGEGDLSSTEKSNLSAGVESICHRLNSGLRLQAESIDLTASRES